MVTKSQPQVDAFRNDMLHACETLYGEGDRDVYFLAKNSTVDDVEKQLIDELSKDSSVPAFVQKKYVNMFACILPTGNDVAIKLI